MTSKPFAYIAAFSTSELLVMLIDDSSRRDTRHAVKAEINRRIPIPAPAQEAEPNPVLAIASQLPGTAPGPSEPTREQLTRLLREVQRAAVELRGTATGDWFEYVLRALELPPNG